MPNRCLRLTSFQIRYSLESIQPLRSLRSREGQGLFFDEQIFLCYKNGTQPEAAKANSLIILKFFSGHFFLRQVTKSTKLLFRFLFTSRSDICDHHSLFSSLLMCGLLKGCCEPNGGRKLQKKAYRQLLSSGDHGNEQLSEFSIFNKEIAVSHQ